MANCFRISSAAKEIILYQLSVSSISRPVIRLIEVGPGGAMPPELVEAMNRGADKTTLRELAIQHIPHLTKDQYRLRPAVFSRWQSPPWNWEKVEGITFVLPIRLRILARGGALDVYDGGLKLVSKRGEVLLPEYLRISR